MAKRVRLRADARLQRNLQGTYMVGEPVRFFLREAATEIRREARADAPVDTGIMRRSHTMTVDSGNPPQWSRVQVEATSRQGADYPWFVHEGTRPHFPPVEAITPWAVRHGIDPWALAVSISRRGTRANPWFERAILRTLPRLRNLAALSRQFVRRWRA